MECARSHWTESRPTRAASTGANARAPSWPASGAVNTRRADVTKLPTSSFYQQASKCPPMEPAAPQVPKPTNSSSASWTWRSLAKLLLVQAILSQLGLPGASGLPGFLQVAAVECNIDSDCANVDKICHENKCICTRLKPIEDQDRCLPLALINEPCTLSEQCLGNSYCGSGFCMCGSDSVILPNPNTQIEYCHPKRQLNDKCIHDSQCPQNSYCSSNDNGCLCLNGYGPGTVQLDGIESTQCLPKLCSESNTCLEDFHSCIDNKCLCLATHFDPTSAKCYKFGSTGGKSTDNPDVSAQWNKTDNVDIHDNNNIYSILRDLKDGDKMWLVPFILISLSILIVILILISLRRYYFGYCWTAHKHEYEPNNKNLPKSSLFNKDSINNKSFRRKTGNAEDGDNDSLAADLSNLVAVGANSDRKQSTGDIPTSATTNSNRNDYVRVNLNGGQTDNPEYHHLVSPLKTSTSTPV